MVHQSRRWNVRQSTDAPVLASSNQEPSLDHTLWSIKRVWSWKNEANDVINGFLGDCGHEDPPREYPRLNGLSALIPQPHHDRLHQKFNETVNKLMMVMNRMSHEECANTVQNERSIRWFSYLREWPMNYHVHSGIRHSSTWTKSTPIVNGLGACLIRNGTGSLWIGMSSQCVPSVQMSSSHILSRHLDWIQFNWNQSHSEWLECAKSQMGRRFLVPSEDPRCFNRLTATPCQDLQSSYFDIDDLMMTGSKDIGREAIDEFKVDLTRNFVNSSSGLCVFVSPRSDSTTHGWWATGAWICLSGYVCYFNPSRQKMKNDDSGKDRR